MTKEEIKNGGEEMLIDGPDQEPVTSDGFNPNYLKVYYGKFYEGFFLMLISSCRSPMEMMGSIVVATTPTSAKKNFLSLWIMIFICITSISRCELENAIKEKCPFKIDIRPVYTVDPAKRHGYSQGGDNNAFFSCGEGTYF